MADTILRGHVSLGVAALALGYLPAEAIAEAIAELATQENPPGEDEFWSAPGRLTSEQLARVRIVLDRDTTQLGADDAVGTGKTQPQPGPASDVSPVGADDNASLGSRYVRVRLLGAGGAGEVFECFDTTLQRSVAVKISRSDSTFGGREKRVLEREARVTSALEHPNIIPVHDAGSDDANRESYYVMRLVDQQTLDDILDRLAQGDAEAQEQYTLGRLLRDFVQICKAVDYAHSRQIVHCDLKPANILLGPFGEVQVVDWGLAYRMTDETGVRGGTPGYMAPEQAASATAKLGPQTDVFALGAILYELLVNEQAFAEQSTVSIIEMLRRRDGAELDIEPPRQRNPDIPEELSDICIKALSFDPEDRWASARDLSQAIERYLDKSEDLARRRVESNKQIDEAEELSERYFEFVESHPEQRRRLASLRARIRPWDPIEKKRELWDAEDAAAVTGSLRVRTLQAAVAAFEQALDLVPGQEDARRGLAKLYWSEVELARERRDQLNEIYFEGLARQYGGGTSRAPNRTGRVRLTVRGEANWHLITVREQERRCAPGRVVAEGVEDADVELDEGRYVVIATRNDREVRFPLLLRPGRGERVEIDADQIAAVVDDEVLVPAGEALLAGDLQPQELGELRRVRVRAFAILRFPVTFRSYFEFLTEELERAPDRLEDILPRDRRGNPYWKREHQAWAPAALPGTADRDELLDLPAFGVDASMASAYAAWLSRRRGLSYRLPTDIEWEKAARGTDGRVFPWGDHFDATFCKMRESRPGHALPEPIGRFPQDESPYGVRDMAGGVAEWVGPGGADGHHMYARGGAWCDWQVDCRLSARRAYLPGERSARLGFRLVRVLD